MRRPGLRTGREPPCGRRPRRPPSRSLPEGRLMFAYALSRIGRALITVVLIVTAAFIILRLTGDPAIIILGPDAPPAAYEAFRRNWGLDEPIWVQYFAYFGAIAEGDLGRSMRDGRPALEVVGERVPLTLSLIHI